MALINCPECGEQRISDTAMVCPKCGFAIREYTETRQREQTKTLLFEAAKQKAATEYTKQEISNCNKIMCIAAFTGVGSFLLALFNKGVNRVVIPCFIVFWSMVAFILILSVICAKRHNDLAMITDNFHEFEYQIQKRNRANKKYQSAVAAAVNAVLRECPVCGSTDTICISENNRAFSVALFGLASSKIGKQYEFKSCKHKW